MIGDTTTLTTSVQQSHHFGPLSSTNNDTASIQPFISSLLMRHNAICECCRRIGQKADACIVRSPKFTPTSLKRKMNQFNDLHGEEPNEPPRERNN